MTTVDTSHMHAMPLLRLMQLASPTLPVGAYSYSQGLEWAVSEGFVHDEDSAARWIEDVLRFSIATFELPCMNSMMTAAAQNDAGELARLNALYLAGRESAELRAESVQMGRSLVRLLHEIDVGRMTRPWLRDIEEPAYPCAWACAANAFELPARQSALAYAWSWLENQVLAAIKLVPLGQSAGQRMLLALSGTIEAVCCRDPVPEVEWTNFSPAFGLASTAHETQYTRLFRS